MISGGYIIQPRCFDESEASKLPPVTRELWFYLLRKVNHKDNCKFKRGQGFFALEDIQKDLSWMVGFRKMTYSKPQLVKSLRRLREGNMVETTKATRGVLVTVCNYSIYQDPKNYEGNDEGTAKERRRKHEGAHLKQECKNEKNEKKLERDSRQADCPHLKIISLYNEKLNELTPVNENLWNGVRKKNLLSRWKEDSARQCEDWWHVRGIG